MCYGEVVSKRLLQAKREHVCAQCNRPIQRRRRFFQITVRSFDEGLLANSTLCLRCQAGVERLWDRGANACAADTDTWDHEMRQEAALTGWRAFRAELRGWIERMDKRRAARPAQPEVRS